MSNNVKLIAYVVRTDRSLDIDNRVCQLQKGLLPVHLLQDGARHQHHPHLNTGHPLAHA